MGSRHASHRMEKASSAEGKRSIISGRLGAETALQVEKRLTPPTSPPGRMQFGLPSDARANGFRAEGRGAEDQPRSSNGPMADSRSHNGAVEDSDLGPVCFVFLDEFQVPLGRLVRVMRWSVLEDAMQRDVEILIHIAIQLTIASANRKANQSVMVIKVLVAGGNQRFNRFITTVDQLKENVVRKFRHGSVLSFGRVGTGIRSHSIVVFPIIETEGPRSNPQSTNFATSRHPLENLWAHRVHNPNGLFGSASVGDVSSGVTSDGFESFFRRSNDSCSRNAI